MAIGVEVGDRDPAAPLDVDVLALAAELRPGAPPIAATLRV
jgi:hypothetical protein